MMTFITTAFINFVIGFVFFVGLVMSLFGWTRNQSAPYLVSYFIWFVICSFLAAYFAKMRALIFEEKNGMNPLKAGLICTILFSVVGGILSFLGIVGEVYLIELLAKKI